MYRSARGGRLCEHFGGYKTINQLPLYISATTCRASPYSEQEAMWPGRKARSNLVRAVSVVVVVDEEQLVPACICDNATGGHPCNTTFFWTS